MHTSWKWSTGETYYRSPRQEQRSLTYDSQQNAINQSLADEPFINQDSDLINITNTIFSRNQHISGTKREDLDTKIADREMIAQRGINPFLQTSYVNDIVAHDMFLKPVNTTFEHIKDKSKEE